MKLVNRLMAGQKLAFSTGIVSVDSEGCVDVEDKAAAEALKASGFKLLFVRGEAPVRPAVIETVSDDSVSTLKLDDKKSAGRKGK